MTIDYNQPSGPLSRYWIAKSNQFVLRQESDLGDRGRLVKMLISGEDADQVSPPITVKAGDVVP